MQGYISEPKGRNAERSQGGVESGTGEPLGLFFVSAFLCDSVSSSLSLQLGFSVS